MRAMAVRTEELLSIRPAFQEPSVSWYFSSCPLTQLKYSLQDRPPT